MVTHKFVNDLGVAAYILMHGYSVIGKKGRSIYFECVNEEASIEFDNLILEYQPPNEYYTFDSCLMFLKKINEQEPIKVDRTSFDVQVVSDLGVAAYLLMHEYRNNNIEVKVIGKKGRNVYFSFPIGKKSEFEQLSYRYLPSGFHQYDSNLMALKKIGEYMPSR